MAHPLPRPAPRPQRLQPVLLILALVWATAQEDGACGANTTQCCSRLRLEAKEACLEYAFHGLDEERCLSWMELAETNCLETCGNCTRIAEELFRQCRFQLQVLGNPALIESHCKYTQNAFEHNRCVAACRTPEAECLSDEGLHCMEQCGNYQQCFCRRQVGTALDPACRGETFLRGEIEGRPGLEHNCARMPPLCYQHTTPPTQCGRYKYCTLDYCIVQNVSCPSTHQCLNDGWCEPALGLCFFTNRPTGYDCSDGLFYTLDDQCHEGECAGTVNYCLKYNVTCESMSSCLTGGVCQPDSGRCLYAPLVDDTPCDDGRGYTVDDRCSQGLCVGRPVDLCVEQGVLCTASNVCYDPGVCDPLTGTCSDSTVAQGERTCDDLDPLTHNDTCIDGVCLGRETSAVGAIKFLTLGVGECADRDGRRMPRYSGDVQDDGECEAVCLGDPQCAGYTFAYPLCSIYGTVRMRAPFGMTTWSFQAGTVPPAVRIETASLVASGQRPSVCRRKGYVGDVESSETDSLDIDVDDYFGNGVLLVFFVSALCCFFLCPCFAWCCRRLRNRRVEDEDEDEDESQAPAYGGLAPLSEEAKRAEKLRAVADWQPSPDLPLSPEQADQAEREEKLRAIANWQPSPSPPATPATPATPTPGALVRRYSTVRLEEFSKPSIPTPR